MEITDLFTKYILNNLLVTVVSVQKLVKLT